MFPVHSQLVTKRLRDLTVDEMREYLKELGMDTRGWLKNRLQAQIKSKSSNSDLHFFNVQVDDDKIREKGAADGLSVSSVILILQGTPKS